MSNEKEVVVIGAGGRMGGAIIRCLVSQQVAGLRLRGAVERSGTAAIGQDAGQLHGAPPAGIPVTSDLAAALEGADVAIDFTTAAAATAHASLLAGAGVAWVLGTTGFTAEQSAAVTTVGDQIPLVMAPNMSLGVNLLLQLVTEAARALALGYDIEIVERHHRHKHDAPSGTALALGRAAAAGRGWELDQVSRHGRSGMVVTDRPEHEIGFHAVRGGDFVGDHTVILAGAGESVELAHRATSRDTFALGALRAAAWAAGRAPGVYDMRAVLGLDQAP